MPATCDLSCIFRVPAGQDQSKPQQGQLIYTCSRRNCPEGLNQNPQVEGITVPVSQEARRKLGNETVPQKVRARSAACRRKQNAPHN